jgi:hypothetical protein
MPLKLDIINDKVVITPSLKVIPEIDKIIMLPSKKKVNQYLMYIYLSCSLDEKNPYRDLPADAKEKEALYRAFNDFKKVSLTPEEEKIILPAKEAFIKYTETADERIVFSYNQKLDELKTLLDDNKPVIERFENASSGEIKFSTNSDIITKIMGNIDILIEKREKIKASLLNQSASGRVKGGYASSLIEKGNFKGISKEEI